MNLRLEITMRTTLAVGAVSLAEIEEALPRLEEALRQLNGA